MNTEMDLENIEDQNEAADGKPKKGFFRRFAPWLITGGLVLATTNYAFRERGIDYHEGIHYGQHFTVIEGTIKKPVTQNSLDSFHEPINTNTPNYNGWHRHGRRPPASENKSLLDKLGEVGFRLENAARGKDSESIDLQLLLESGETVNVTFPQSLYRSWGTDESFYFLNSFYEEGSKIRIGGKKSSSSPDTINFRGVDLFYEDNKGNEERFRIADPPLINEGS